MMIYALLAVCFATGSLAHPPPLESGESKCPYRPTVQNFDKNQYAGVWYEQARYESKSEKNLECVTATYTLDPENGTIVMVNSGIHNVTKKEISIKAIATVPTDPNEASKLSIKFITVPGMPTADYWILDTDYDTYTIVYACNPRSGRESAWLLTRVPEPNEFDIDELMNIALDHSVDIWSFELVDQSNCNYTSKALNDNDTPPQVYSV